MTRPPLHRTVRRKVLLLALSASAPASWLLLFASYVLRARLALGRWPTPYHPDPHALGFHIHQALVVLAWPLSLVLALVGFVTGWLPSRTSVPWRWAAALSILSVASTAGLIAIARVNPGYLFAWFMD